MVLYIQEEMILYILYVQQKCALSLHTVENAKSFKGCKVHDALDA